VREEIDRIREIWRECRTRFGTTAEFLFGQFTVADAMFAPVASRFQTYDVELDRIEAEYVRAVLALPAAGEWMEDARREQWTITKFDQA
jgi:glutathione S-transferase